tara:strand:+ start:11255 stop:12892 length:1638 start_codon:yes stop_codon:yes gene_type:complete
MAKRVQRRRGTTSEHATFTGYDGETTVDTTKDTVIVHDGATTGGFPLAREDLSNVSLTNLIGVNELNLIEGSADQVIKTNGAGTISFGTIDVTGSAVGGDISGTVGNAQIVANAVGIAEINVTDGTNGQALITNGAGTLTFGDVLTDPALGGHLSGTTSAAVINQDTITSGMLTTALKNFTIDEFVGVAAQTTFTLTASVGSINALLVYIDGIVQPTSAYALPTTTSIQFLTAPPASSIIRCLHLGFQSTVGVPSDGTVTTAKIASNAVTAAKFADGSVSTAKIASNAVTEAKITAQTITNASIYPGTIRSQEIENGTIVGTDIANNSIDGTKIALGSDAQGDVMYYSGTNWVRLAAGTAGQQLQSGGASANPSWANSAGTASGSIVQSRSVIYTTTSTFTSSYGSNGFRRNTPFLISEGIELQTLAITPISTSNYLRIFASVLCDTSVDGVAPMIVLHRDAITNGLQVGSSASYGNGGWHASDPGHVTLDHIMQVPSTSAQTYRIRAGTSGHMVAGALFINQKNTGACWGGIGQSVMTIVEYVP